MYTLKNKISDKLSYLFPDSSSSSKYSTVHDQSQVRPKSKGGRYLSSFYSYILPSASPDGSESNKNQEDVEPFQSPPAGWIDKNFEWRNEHLGKGDISPIVCGGKETQDTQEEYEDPHSAKSFSDSDVFEEAIDPSSLKSSIPNLSEDSSFISSDLYEFLESSLPNIVKGRQWALLYSTAKHGISLRTLIRKSADLSGPCLLIAGDTQGAVFGGLLECPLKPTAKRKYQGTAQTFVFTTIYGEPRLFRATVIERTIFLYLPNIMSSQFDSGEGEIRDAVLKVSAVVVSFAIYMFPPFFYLCLNELLALGGGGHFALCFDEDLLSGTSGSCDTFGNVCLAHSPEFKLKNVELWGFTHLSQYLT